MVCLWNQLTSVLFGDITVPCFNLNLKKRFIVIGAMFMLLQIARIGETFAAQRTHVRFLSHVDSQMTKQVHGVSKCLVTHVTLVRFFVFSAVNSAVSNNVVRPRKSLATNTTFKRFISRMTSHVFRQIHSTLVVFAALEAPVFTCVNIHMPTEATHVCKMLITFIT